MNTIRIQQTTFGELLLRVPPTPRLLIVTVVSAIAAYYAPLLAVAVTGNMVNRLAMWTDAGINVALLLVVSAIGNRLNRVWLVSCVAAALLMGYQISLALRMPTPQGWWDWAWRSALPAISFLLNAFFVTRAKQHTNLEHTASS